VLEPGDLFLSFLRGPGLANDDLPRLGVWQPNGHALPRNVHLSDAGRDWIAAMGLPTTFRERGAAERSEDMIRAAMTDRVEASGPELDDRMRKNAQRHRRPSGIGPRRTRGKSNVTKATKHAGHSIERHLDTRRANQGKWALEGVRTDVDLLLAAVAEERWSDARRILEIAATPRWDAPVADFDLANTEIPSDHVSDPTARKMLRAAIAMTVDRPAPITRTLGDPIGSRERSASEDPATEQRSKLRVPTTPDERSPIGGSSGGRMPPRYRRPAGVAAAAGLALVAGLSVVVLAGGSAGKPLLSAHERMLRAQGKVLVVSNLVTSGTHMTEDPEPAVLTGRPVPICCTVKGSQRRTGDRYDAAVCQVFNGPYDTNGNDTTAADDKNPGLAKSYRYYGVLLADGRFGFTSAVWVEKSERGGLGLPRCAGDKPPA
jgi:hypothetical protein